MSDGFWPIVFCITFRICWSHSADNPDGIFMAIALNLWIDQRRNDTRRMEVPSMEMRKAIIDRVGFEGKIKNSVLDRVGLKALFTI